MLSVSVFSRNVGGLKSADLSFIVDEIFFTRNFSVLCSQEVTNSKTIPKECHKNFNRFYSKVLGERKRSAIILDSNIVDINHFQCIFGVVIETNQYIIVNVHLPSKALTNILIMRQIR